MAGSTGQGMGQAPMMGGRKGGVPGGSVQDKSSWAYDQALNSANAMGPLNYHQSAAPGQAAPIDVVQGGEMQGGEGASMMRNLNMTPDAIYQGYGNYMNPYKQEVVDRTTADMMRQNAMAQDVNAANASAAGAFGGSRHGLVEAQTNAETNRNIGNISAQLNQQGFGQAMGLSNQDIQNRMAGNQMSFGQAQALSGLQGQDIGNQFQQSVMNQAANMFDIGNQMQNNQFNVGNRMRTDQLNQQNLAQRASLMSGLSNQGFDVGNYLTNQQMQYGNQQQQLLQQVLTGGANQFDQYMNSPYQQLNVNQSAMAGNPLAGNSSSTQTQTYNPGLGQWAALGAQTYGQTKGVPKG